jgi:hypothetical protein
MSDNVIKSTDINKASDKPAKKAPAKKAAPKKQESIAKEQEDVANTAKDGFVIVIFESGSSYTSNGIRFTRENNIQEIPSADAQLLLQLDNFRLANQFEIEDYLNSKED